MKPELQKIFTKLSEDKLQKVDLSEAKAKAITKKFRAAEKGLKEQLKILEKIESQVSGLAQTIKQAEKELPKTVDFMEMYGKGKESYNNLYDIVKKQANELGIKPESIPYMKELNKSFDDAADAYRPASYKHAVLVSEIREATGKWI